MKKFISGLLVGALLMSAGTFASSNLTAIKSVFKITVNGKAVSQNVVTIDGTYYADIKQLAGNLGVKYSIDEKEKKIALGETPLPKELTAKDYCKLLISAGLPIGKVVTYTAETDKNKLLGRPKQYTSKVNFSDTTLEQGGSDPVGGSIEVFESNQDAQTRKAYIDKIGEETPLFLEYSYINGKALLRLNSDLTPEQANKYKDAFMKIK